MADSETTPPASSSRRRISFLDLPEETQKEIFSHCHPPELACLSLVSRHFRHIAASELYRLVDIVFPIWRIGQPVVANDYLCQTLETFVSSEYNYAQHLHALCFDTSTVGASAEISVDDYQYSKTSGRLLNTMLLLTVRRAVSLEKFFWNVRVELNHTVYKALHQSPTLRTVVIRLPVGSSSYKPPPPLPNLSSSPTAELSSTTPLFPEPLAAYGEFSYPPAFAASSTALPLSKPVPALSTPPPPPLSLKRQVASRPATIGGFKNLKALSVLDIDSLDIITEIKTAVRNSNATLMSLSLSFSYSLATKARRPTTADMGNDSDISDVENEVESPAMLGTSIGHASGAKKLSPREEKTIQEAALGRIFDIEPYHLAGSQETPADGDSDGPKKTDQRARGPEVSSTSTGASVGSGAGAGAGTGAGVEFAEAVWALAACITAKASGDSGPAVDQTEAFEKIRAAAMKFTAEKEQEKERKQGLEQEHELGLEGETTKKARGKENSKGKGILQETPVGISSVGTGEDADVEELEEDSGPSTSISAPVSIPGLFYPGNKTSLASGDLQPEDIDIEEPEGELILDPHGSPSEREIEAAGTDGMDVAIEQGLIDHEDKQIIQHASEETLGPQNGPVKGELLKAAALSEASSQAIRKLIGNLEAQKNNYKILSTDLARLNEELLMLDTKIGQLRKTGSVNHWLITETERQMQAIKERIHYFHRVSRTIEAEVVDIERQVRTAQAAASAVSDSDTDAQKMLVSDYARFTRGLALESFSAYLIPVKASVLSRAVDLRTLTSLTLLNVGQQAPIWTMLGKENSTKPLALRSIFTDNVTIAFLQFVSQLDVVHDLFLLERDSKYKPVSFAPSTTVSIGNIRNLALRKHVPHLKRLYINSTSVSWDLDEPTLKLLTRRARKLIELAASLNIKSMHRFLQRISGFSSLKALHIIHLRNEDLCVWVLRETRRFLLDALSHYPDHELEWVCIDSEPKVCYLCRVDPKEAEKKKRMKRLQKLQKQLQLLSGEGKDKGKGKAKETNTNALINPVLISLGLGGFAASGVDGSGSNSGESSALGTLTGLASVDVSDGSDTESDMPRKVAIKTMEVAHSDVVGIRIFTKEVMAGRL